MEAIENIAVKKHSYHNLIAQLDLKIEDSGKARTKFTSSPESSATADFETITEGGRNAALTSLAGLLRRKGLDGEFIRRILLTQNLAACKPPLPAEEVERIASSIQRYDPQSNDTLSRTLTDTGNADRFKRDWENRIRYVPTWKKWLVWDESRWVKDAVNQVMELGKETAQRIYEEGVGQKDEKLRTSISKHSAKSQQAERIKAMINLATSIPSLVVPATELDSDPMALGVANGVLDLKTGQLRPSRREDLMTKQSPVTFDPGAKCPRFEAFIREVMRDDAELVDYLRRVTGYCLTGLTDEQCLFFFYGSGANGKSTFLNVLKDLLGDDYCKQTPSETLMVKKHGRNSTNDLARLVGIRSVISNEVEEGSRLSESLIKELTGGDTISARFLFAEFFDFIPQFKLLIAGNHQPVIRGDDNGIWRRLHLIPFTVTIPPEKRDPKLSEVLREELPGILNWALAGCLEWQEKRLTPPKVVTEAVQAYRTDMDILGQWIDDKGKLGSEEKVGASEAYRDYKIWAMCNGFQQMSSNAFGRRLGERFKRKKTSEGKFYLGLSLVAQLH